MKCWRCGQSMADSMETCGACGASQARTAVSTEVGRTLRALYDRFGAQEILTNSSYIFNGLGSAAEDAKKARGLFQLALDIGVGQLFLEQLRDKGYWDGDFVMRVYQRLVDDAGMNNDTSIQMISWFNEMIGWAAAEEKKPRYSARRSHKILGIDLGGSTARIAVIEGGRATPLPNTSGGSGRPCAAGFKDGRLIACEDALQQAIHSPENTSLSFKTQIATGRLISLGKHVFQPQLLSALILRRLREDAYEYLYEDPSSVVITVPNSYTSKQRQAVIDAGRMAGLTVERVINNTSAAALCIECQDTKEAEGLKYLICNMGSTSFDVSVTVGGDGVVEVISSDGDALLGGNDFTDCIADWIVNQFRQEEKLDLSQDPTAMARVWEAAETAKKDLSVLMSVQISIPYAAMREGQPLCFDRMLTRAAFNEMTASLREKADNLIRSVLNGSGFSPKDIDRVVFVGGGSRMPAMQDTLRKIMGKSIWHVNNPEECTVCGAAIMGGILNGDVKDTILLDVTAHSLGIETAGGVCTTMIERNSTFPAGRKQSFSTSADNQTTLDIHLLEGEHEKAADNETIGRFQIRDIPIAFKGVPNIEVEFVVDANGIVSVYAEDVGRGKKRRLTPLDQTAAGEELIEKSAAMVEQAAESWIK